jgi:hypothetical protein
VGAFLHDGCNPTQDRPGTRRLKSNCDRWLCISA